MTETTATVPASELLILLSMTQLGLLLLCVSEKTAESLPDTKNRRESDLPQATAKRRVQSVASIGGPGRVLQSGAPLIEKTYGSHWSKNNGIIVMDTNENRKRSSLCSAHAGVSKSLALIETVHFNFTEEVFLRK